VKGELKMEKVDQVKKETWDMLQQLVLEHKIMKDEIMALFKETAQRSKETDKQIKETGQQIKESERMMAQRSKETERMMAERFKETERLLSERFRETDQFLKESSQKADKYLGKIKEFDRNWGKLVESLVAPGMVEQFKKINLDIDGMTQRVQKRKQGKNFEVDILLTNSNLIIPVEVKTTLNVEAVNEHIEKHLIPFKTFFPEYKDKAIYGAVAYIHVEENADRYAYKKGLYVLTFGDNDMVIIKNDPQFKPVAW